VTAEQKTTDEQVIADSRKAIAVLQQTVQTLESYVDDFRKEAGVTQASQIPEGLGPRAQALTDAVRALDESTSLLQQRMGTQEDIAHRLRRTVRWLAAVIVVVIVLAGAGAVVVDRQVHLNSSLNAQQTEVMCPLLNMFLGSYRPDAVPPERRPTVEGWIADIRRMSTHVLSCPPVPTIPGGR
jgi:hypothetical protein